MRIAICDDEKIFYQDLANHLNYYSQEKATIINFDRYSSGKDLLLSDVSYDVIFLDYQMPDLNGLEVANKLREKNVKSLIIFLTSYPDIVFDTFKVNAFRFLTKPINKDKLFDALNDILKYYDNDNFIILTNNSSLSKINIDDIYFVEADNKSSIIHLSDKTIYQPKLLSFFEKALPPDKFFRCHKSFIVGFKHIAKREGYEIIFDNRKSVYAGKTKITEFKNKYIEYLKQYTFEVS